MIKNSFKDLCLLSVFCGAALSISPEGNVKRVMSILVSAVLMLSFLSPLKNMDLSSYALSMGKLREKEQELSANGSELRSRMDRLCIERELEAYIMDKAAKLGIDIYGLRLELYWSTEGLWLPEAVYLQSDADLSQRKALSGIISADLGIDPERQYWNVDG